MIIRYEAVIDRIEYGLLGCAIRLGITYLRERISQAGGAGQDSISNAARYNLMS